MSNLLNYCNETSNLAKYDLLQCYLYLFIHCVTNSDSQSRLSSFLNVCRRLDDIKNDHNRHVSEEVRKNRVLTETTIHVGFGEAEDDRNEKYNNTMDQFAQLKEESEQSEKRVLESAKKVAKDTESRQDHIQEQLNAIASQLGGIAQHQFPHAQPVSVISSDDDLATVISTQSNSNTYPSSPKQPSSVGVGRNNIQGKENNRGPSTTRPSSIHPPSTKRKRTLPKPLVGEGRAEKHAAETEKHKAEKEKRRQQDERDRSCQLFRGGAGFRYH